jgi:hypothetical protein
MSHFRAENLDDVSKVISLEPLDPGDRFYTDLAIARGTKDLLKLRQYLENCARNEQWACAAFIGHRGSGKSTELKRLEGKLGPHFTPLHLMVDNSLQLDCDYTDLLLWLVDSVVNFFEKEKLPLDGTKAKAVADWFADRTIETAEALKSEISLETSAETSGKAGVNLGFLAYSVKLLAKLKARVVGNREHRTVARRKLQNYSDELIACVNDLLAHARDVLAGNKRPDRLLIVQDNLDRLRPEAALRLFRDNGDLLKQIAADCIWTVPINSRLAPFGIHTLFNHLFSMPTIKVRDRAGKKVNAGINGLVDLVGRRIQISDVFVSREVVAFLAEMSGGSVRDLLRLVGEAQLAAQVDGLDRIDMNSAKEAVKKLRLDFQGLSVPGDAYYPLLANVARTKQDAVTTASASPEQAANNRAFFAELLVNGSILEYNGEERWFDVHPVVLDIDAFRNASKPVKTKKPARTKA